MALTGSAFGGDKPLKPLTPTFDKFKNTTTIGSWMIEVGNTVHRGGSADSAKGSNGREYGLSEMSVGAVILCPGNVDSCSPSMVTLDFHSYTRQWIFMTAHSVILLIDGARESLGAGEWNGLVLGANFLDETIAVAIPTDLFVKIANARTVDVQINGFEFSLKDKNFAALKQLAEHLDQSNPQTPAAPPVSSAPEPSPPAFSVKTPAAQPTVSTVPEATKKALIENTEASKTSPAAAAQLAQDGRSLTPQEQAQFIQDGKASKTAVITRPAGAEVYIDGNKIGVTPLVFVLIKRDAPRAITIKLAGYKTVEKAFVPDGKLIPIGITLEKETN